MWVHKDTMGLGKEFRQHGPFGFGFLFCFWMPAIFHTLEFGDFSSTKQEVGGRVIDYKSI